MSKLPYNLSTLAAIGAVKVIVSKYVADNQIVLRQPRDLSRQPSLAPTTFVSYHIYHISIWDLDKGEVTGDCDPTKATEWHMSPKRFRELQELTEDVPS
jgi:hypothetical protein